MASEMKEENSSTSSDQKNEENLDEKKKIDNDTKDDDKDSVKSETKEESGKEASEDESDDDSDDEVALLDRPVEVTGCRARKKVERLEVSFTTPKEKHEFPEGKGKKLGDCPRIEAQILKMKPIDLKPMHKILFNRTGSANEIKKNIRKFSGFPFDENSAEFTRKKASVEKLTASVLKQVCLILDIERGGTKEDIVTRIMSFLLKPEDSGKKVPAPKKKVSKDKKKSTGKKVKSEKKVKSSKDDSDDDVDDSNEEEEEEEEDDDSTGGEASMGGTDEEAEALLTEPKKKSKESKKSKPKAERGKKDEKKQKATKRKHDDDEDKSSASSDDEPAAKKSKMPSDEEISKLVKQILESADLQEITMKKVIKQVSDTYPDFDLSHKKAFIKSTIKSIL